MHFLQAPLNKMPDRLTDECKKVFEKIKDILMSDLFLMHYDTKREIIIASDASVYGVDAIILHKNEDRSLKPTAHTSRTLLLAEKNYIQIEKESLAFIFIHATKISQIHPQQIYPANWLQTIMIHLWLKMICWLIQLIDDNDWEPFYSIMISK